MQITAPNILIIDDNETDRYIIKRLLDKFLTHFIPHEAINGQEALNILKAGTPDIIFLDLNMPIMNGFEFLEAFERLDPNPKVKIVLLTSSVDFNDKKKAKSYKFVVKYFEKMPPVHQLQKTITELLTQG